VYVLFVDLAGFFKCPVLCSAEILQWNRNQICRLLPPFADQAAVFMGTPPLMATVLYALKR